MKRLILLNLLVILFTLGQSQNWIPKGDFIKTPWAEKVDPSNPLPEYSRPIMERDQWQNLNGLWD